MAVWEKEIDPSADRLFVTKVPQTATKEDITTHFSKFGTTTDVYVPHVPGQNGHKGIAFVSYAEPASLQLAISNGPHEITGQEVVVDVAAPRGQAPGRQSAPTQEQAHQPTQSSDRLFVTKVPPHLTRENVREHFEQFGELTDVYMPSVPGGATHKGICFVSFSDSFALNMALQHTPHEVQGHQVVVDIAAPRGPTPGKGGGSNFHQSSYSAPQYQAAPPQAHAPQSHYSAPHAGYQGGYAAAMPPAQAPHAAQGYAAAAAPVHSSAGLNSSTGVPVPGRLFVTRVTPDMSKVDLQLYFQQFGTLNDVFVPTGNKGIAFVTFSDVNTAQTVLQAQQHFVKPGKAVLVDQAMDRPPIGGGKGGGQPGAYGGGGGFGGGGYGHGGAYGGGRPPPRYSPY